MIPIIYIPLEDITEAITTMTDGILFAGTSFINFIISNPILLIFMILLIAATIGTLISKILNE